MRIGWYSNAPWTSTGYGVQTALATRALADQGHDVAVFANFGLEGGALNWGPVKVYPKGWTDLSLDTLAANARDWEADIVVSLFDAWVLRHDLIQHSGVRWCPWFPIDSEPIPDQVIRQVREAWQPLVFSRHGLQLCEEAGVPALYVPHAFDEDVYRVTCTRAEARERRGLPGDVFLVAVVAANKGVPSRKAWPEMLQAFAALRRRHTDAVLYMHTVVGIAHQGYELLKVAESFGIPSDAVVVCDQYRQTLGFPTTYMRDVYQAADVLLNPSFGEGFGVPIMEAQACGTPVIVGGWTAMPELVDWGWQVHRDECQPWWTPQGAFQFQPSVPAITARLEEAYQAKASGVVDDLDARQACASRARDRFGLRAVVRDHWAPAIDQMRERIARETQEGARPAPEVLAA